MNAYVRFSNINGGTEPWIYSHCVACTGVADDEWEFHGPAAPGIGLLLQYDVPTNGWGWWIGQNGSWTLARYEANIGMGRAKRLDVGGETTHWTFDMGVSKFSEVSYLVRHSSTSYEWKDFSPSGGKLKGFYPPGDLGSGRYFAAAAREMKIGISGSGYGASRVSIASDHYISGTPDACFGPTPTRLPTAAPTPTPLTARRTK